MQSGRLETIGCMLIAPQPQAWVVHEPAIPAVEVSQPPHQPGQVVWANVLNPIENPDATGKIRPVVLVSSTGSHWYVMGLTSKTKYATGADRVPIPNYSAVGLDGPGYLWGNRLTRITSESIESFIGFADDALVEAIIEIARDEMSSLQIDDLRSVTRPAARKQQTEMRQTVPTTATHPDIRLVASSLLEFLDRNTQTVKESLATYFHTGSYTGRHFETFSRLGNPRQFDGNDIAAVMCLSVKVAPNVPSQILSLATFGGMQIVDSPIWHRPKDDYEDGSDFNRVYELLRDIENVGPTIASKLMASKFPHAVPIWDRDVFALLGRPSAWWLGWYEALQNVALRRKLQELRQDLQLEHVSLLRIADVALWMEAQRRKKTGSL